jgi:hypothetical protein
MRQSPTGTSSGLSRPGRQGEGRGIAFEYRAVALEEKIDSEGVFLIRETSNASDPCNIREIRDPRDFNARHDVAAMLFIALAATLCGAKSSVDIADQVLGQLRDLAISGKNSCELFVSRLKHAEGRIDRVIDGLNVLQFRS